MTRKRRSQAPKTKPEGLFKREQREQQGKTGHADKKRSRKPKAHNKHKRNHTESYAERHGRRHNEGTQSGRPYPDGQGGRKPGLLLEGYFMTSRKGFGFVRTRNAEWPDIFIAERNVGDARQYDHVLVRLFTDIEEYQKRGRKIDKETRMEGTILQVLHHVDEVDLQAQDGADMQMVMWQLGAPGDFPQAVLDEAKAAPQTVSEEELFGRRDCRSLPLVTIDGVDSRDFDDAVFCTRLESGNYFLSVHIADVAHYVQMGSELEQEAFARATSVYLPDRVLPMLPKELSNGICSLNAGVDRLTLACDMEFTPRGRRVNYDIYPAVINVAKRLDYDTVNAILLDHDRKLTAENRDVLPLLKPLAALQRILEKMRTRRGALNFDFPEVKVKMAENGRVAEVVKRHSRLAEKMIEQAMLAANETVAEHFRRKQIPFVYRVHEGPKEEKLFNLNVALLAFGYNELGDAEGNVSPKEVQNLLKQAAGRPEDEFMQLMALRSMSHAAYSPDCSGHFGLAAKYYCHFTSPIRRYADLAVHRAIKHDLAQPDDSLKVRKMSAYMAAAAQQSSVRERLAEEIEREAVKMKCCLYMQEHLGGIFAGKVAGMTAGGVFVALENGIEGRVGVDDLPPDEYNYIAETMLMQGKTHRFTLGDELWIQVARVDLLERRIDFVPAPVEQIPAASQGSN